MSKKETAWPKPGSPADKKWRKGIKMCVDRFATEERNLLRMARMAEQENPSNRPRLVGVVEIERTPLQIALVTSKKWEVGRTLGIAFLEGSPGNQKFVRDNAEEWLKYANIKFQWGVSATQAEIRITFRQGLGSWSYIGTDCLGIPKNQQTMNFGWLDPGTVMHEFGHALGAIHEHQHPEAGIPWVVDAVYRYYSGPPNNWDRATIDSNIFQKYSRELTQFSAYDTKSIMHYPIDPQLTSGGFAVGWNKELSANDKSFMAQEYPGAGTPPPVPPGVQGKIELPEKGSYRVLIQDGKKSIVFE